MSGIVLSASVRQNLLSLQSTADLTPGAVLFLLLLLLSIELWRRTPTTARRTGSTC